MYCNCMTSEYYPLFCELGYPELDVQFYEDREWAIIQFENAPIVPSLTKWRVVFSGFRNIEFNASFAKKLVNMIDNRKKEFWDNLEAKELAAKKEKEAAENQRVEAYADVAQKLARNPALMERAEKQGVEAFNLNSILKALSPHQVRNVLGPSVQIFH